VAPLRALRRVLKVIEAIGQRSVYFALLHESRAARRRLVELCGHGDFLADQIASHPLLLDELLDERLFSELPTARVSVAILTSPCNIWWTTTRSTRWKPCAISSAPPSFASPSPISPAGCHHAGERPADRYRRVIVDRAMDLAWQQITAQFGVPICDEGQGRRPGARVRHRLRQARRNGIELRLGSRPRLPA